MSTDPSKPSREAKLRAEEVAKRRRKHLLRLGRLSRDALGSSSYGCNGWHEAPYPLESGLDSGGAGGGAKGLAVSLGDLTKRAATSIEEATARASRSVESAIGAAAGGTSVGTCLGPPGMADDETYVTPTSLEVGHGAPSDVSEITARTERRAGKKAQPENGAVAVLPPSPTGVMDVCGFQHYRAVAERLTRECDYDANPTMLFRLIKTKDWDGVVERCRQCPRETLTWISRHRRDSSDLRWRRLPIHAAVAGGAPERAVEALLCGYPPGVETPDDRGMLPLHLAFRGGRYDDAVVTALLNAFPGAVGVRDDLGRIPLVLAEASAGGPVGGDSRALVASQGRSNAGGLGESSDRTDLTAQYERHIEKVKRRHQRRSSKTEADFDVERVMFEAQIQILEGGRRSSR